MALNDLSTLYYPTAQMLIFLYSFITFPNVSFRSCSHKSTSTSTSSRFSENRLFNSKTRSCDITLSPNTSFNICKHSVGDFWRFRFLSVEQVKADAAELFKRLTTDELQHYFEKWKTLMHLCIYSGGMYVEGINS